MRACRAKYVSSDPGRSGLAQSKRIPDFLSASGFRAVFEASGRVSSNEERMECVGPQAGFEFCQAFGIERASLFEQAVLLVFDHLVTLAGVLFQFIPVKDFDATALVADYSLILQTVSSETDGLTLNS